MLGGGGKLLMSFLGAVAIEAVDCSVPSVPVFGGLGGRCVLAAYSGPSRSTRTAVFGSLVLQVQQARYRVVQNCANIPLPLPFLFLLHCPYTYVVFPLYFSLEKKDQIFLLFRKLAHAPA